MTFAVLVWVSKKEIRFGCSTQSTVVVAHLNFRLIGRADVYKRQEEWILASGSLSRRQGKDSFLNFKWPISVLQQEAFKIRETLLRYKEIDVGNRPSFGPLP